MNDLKLIEIIENISVITKRNHTSIEKLTDSFEKIINLLAEQEKEIEELNFRINDLEMKVNMT